MCLMNRSSIFVNRKRMNMISVIMPIYNAKDYVEDAIYCILNQTEKDFELILVDDCGTDGSIEIAEKIVEKEKDSRIRIIRNKKNMGIAYSRNIAIEIAKGEYIAPMDHDDLVSLDRLERTKKFLDENDDIDVVSGSFQKIDGSDNYIAFSKRVFCNPDRIKSEIMFRNLIANGASMFRKKFILENNIKYKDNYLGMEDYQFWLECAQFGKIANLQKVLLYMRIHGNNETLNSRNNKSEKRKKLYDEMRLSAFEKRGFKFSEHEKEVFSYSFDEMQVKSLDETELDEALNFLKVVIKQTEKLASYNNEQIKQMKYSCHDMFALKTRTSYLWQE